MEKTPPEQYSAARNCLPYHVHKVVFKICDANLSNQVNTPQHDAVRTQESSTFHPTNQKMARNIEPWQRKMIVHMIRSEKCLITSQIAEAEGIRVYS